MSIYLKLQDCIYGNTRYIKVVLWYTCTLYMGGGAKGDWDFQISGPGKNPDGTDI